MQLFTVESVCLNSCRSATENFVVCQSCHPIELQTCIRNTIRKTKVINRLRVTYQCRALLCFWWVQHPNGGSSDLRPPPPLVCLLRPACSSGAVQHGSEQSTCCSANWGSSDHWPLSSSSRQAPTCHLCLVAMISTELLRDFLHWLLSATKSGNAGLTVKRKINPLL